MLNLKDRTFRNQAYFAVGTLALTGAGLYGIKSYEDSAAAEDARIMQLCIDHARTADGKPSNLSAADVVLFLTELDKTRPVSGKTLIPDYIFSETSFTCAFDRSSLFNPVIRIYLDSREIGTTNRDSLLNYLKNTER